MNGRYVIIYSKYYLSCALTGKDSGNCEGYVPEDALKLGSNIVTYAASKVEGRK